MKALRQAVAVLTLVCAPMALAGCVTPAGGADVRRDVNDLKQSSYQYRKDIADNRKAIESLKQSQQSVPSEQSIMALKRSQTNLNDRITAIQKEVQSLIDMVERDIHSARKLSQETASEVDVLKTSGGSADVTRRLAAIEAELALIKKKLAIRKGAAASARGTDDPDESPSPAGSPEEAYKSAYALFKKGKHPGARKAFKAFLIKHKGHKWAGNAQFWIGETHYAEGAYDSAILSYDDVQRNYPMSNKVPDAMLKQGYAYLKLKDPLAAKGTFSDLIRLHPNSNAASLARKKLKALK